MKTLRLSFAALIIAAAAICTSCNSHDSVKEANQTNDQKMDTTANAAPMATNAVPQVDAEFATKVASVGMTEVQLGQMASEKGQSKQVKAFGAMMVKDHTEAGDNLKAIAASKNLTLPATVSNDQQSMIDELSKKNGAQFDKTYIDMMVHGHSSTVDDFNKEISDGKDAEITGFANKYLPVIKNHLDAAKTIQSSLK